MGNTSRITTTAVAGALLVLGCISVAAPAQAADAPGQTSYSEEDEASYRIRIELPGISTKDVSITVEDGILQTE